MIIGVTGYKGAGKDTVGDYLLKKYGFRKLSFAEKGKIVICETFGITMEELDTYKNTSAIEVILADKFVLNSNDEPFAPQPIKEMTFRQFIQKLLNEGMKSAYGNMFHVNQLLPPDFEHIGFKYVICDTRFPFEAMRIKELGGYVARVVRPGTGGDDSHMSEQPLPSELVDFTLYNSGTIADLEEHVNDFIRLIEVNEHTKLILDEA